MGTFQEIMETNEIFVLENSLLKNLRLKIKDLSLNINTEASSKFCAWSKIQIKGIAKCVGWIGLDLIYLQQFEKQCDIYIFTVF